MTATPVDLLVAIPAHDEQGSITGCLLSVAAAVRHAVAAGHVRRPLIAVAAHRCSDATGATALNTMTALPVPFLLDTDADSRTVGEVRARLVDRVASRHRLSGSGWLFNTDADSTVPLDWVTSTVERLQSAGAVAAAGMVEVMGWTASPVAHRRYRQIIEAGVGAHGHSHVYGANLAVRQDAYRSVGGFRSVPHGEDQDLIDRLRDDGLPVLSTFTPMVTTSGRMPGRAAHGLGRLLAELADDRPGPAERDRTDAEPTVQPPVVSPAKTSSASGG